MRSRELWMNFNPIFFGELGQSSIQNFAVVYAVCLLALFNDEVFLHQILLYILDVLKNSRNRSRSRSLLSSQVLDETPTVPTDDVEPAVPRLLSEQSKHPRRTRTWRTRLFSFLLQVISGRSTRPTDCRRSWPVLDQLATS